MGLIIKGTIPRVPPFSLCYVLRSLEGTKLPKVSQLHDFTTRSDVLYTVLFSKSQPGKPSETPFLLGQLDSWF